MAGLLLPALVGASSPASAQTANQLPRRAVRFTGDSPICAYQSKDFEYCVSISKKVKVGSARDTGTIILIVVTAIPGSVIVEDWIERHIKKAPPGTPEEGQSEGEEKPTKGNDHGKEGLGDCMDPDTAENNDEDVVLEDDCNDGTYAESMWMVSEAKGCPYAHNLESVYWYKKSHGKKQLYLTMRGIVNHGSVYLSPLLSGKKEKDQEWVLPKILKGSPSRGTRNVC